MACSQAAEPFECSTNCKPCIKPRFVNDAEKGVAWRHEREAKTTRACKEDNAGVVGLEE